MKKYNKEIIMLLLQLFMFYIFPVFAGPTDAIGMVILIIISTALFSFVLGIISKEVIKFLYPPVIALLFIPSVFIYYNESALVHSLWYLVISGIGMGTGSLMRFIFCRIQCVKKFIIVRNIFIALSLIISHCLCIVVAFNYSNMLCGIEHKGFSAPASTAFYFAIPYCIALLACVAVAFIFNKKA